MWCVKCDVCARAFGGLLLNTDPTHIFPSILLLPMWVKLVVCLFATTVAHLWYFLAKNLLVSNFVRFSRFFFFFGGVTGFMNWKWISACLTLVVWFMEIGMAAELSDWTETVAEVGCFDQKDCAVVFKLFLDSNEQSQTRDTSHTVMSSTSIGYVRHHIHSLTHIPGFPLYLVQWFLKVGSRNLKGVPRADQLKKQ